MASLVPEEVLDLLLTDQALCHPSWRKPSTATTTATTMVALLARVQQRVEVMAGKRDHCLLAHWRCLEVCEEIQSTGGI